MNFLQTSEHCITGMTWLQWTWRPRWFSVCVWLCVTHCSIMFSGSIRQWEENGGGLLCMAVPAAISSYKTKSLARKTDSHTLTPIFFNVLCSVFPTLKKTSYSGLIRERRACVPMFVRMSLCHVRFLEGVCSIGPLSCGSVCVVCVGALISAFSIRVNSYEILYHIGKVSFYVCSWQLVNWRWAYKVMSLIITMFSEAEYHSKSVTLVFFEYLLWKYHDSLTCTMLMPCLSLKPCKYHGICCDVAMPTSRRLYHRSAFFKGQASLFQPVSIQTNEPWKYINFPLSVYFLLSHILKLWPTFYTNRRS